MQSFLQPQAASLGGNLIFPTSFSFPSYSFPWAGDDWQGAPSGTTDLQNESLPAIPTQQHTPLYEKNMRLQFKFGLKYLLVLREGKGKTVI